MSDKRTVTIELEEGEYLVSVDPRRPTRIWKHEGRGRVSGNGGKFTKPSIGQAFYEITVMGQHFDEDEPGGGPGGLGTPPGSPGSGA